MRAHRWRALNYSFECIGNVEDDAGSLESSHKAWVITIIGVPEQGRDRHRAVPAGHRRVWGGSRLRGSARAAANWPGYVKRFEKG